MSFRFRHPGPLHALAIGLSILTASAALVSQTPAHPTPAQPPRLKSWSEVHPASLPTTERWAYQTRAWEAFLLKVNFHPATPGQERECQCKRLSRSKELGITVEEERILLDSLYPIRMRIDQLRLAFHETIAAPNEIPVEEQQRRLKIFQKDQEDPVLVEMIAQIKRELSPESFKLLDAFVYAESDPGRYALGKAHINPVTAHPLYLSAHNNLEPR